MTSVFVGLGGNAPSTQESFTKARDRLSDYGTVAEASSILRTEPWNVDASDPFLNQVLELRKVDPSPERLLSLLLEFESELGRDRSNEPDRVIDLDLLYYGSLIRRQPELRLPHPRVHRRPFVLQSMVELAPTFLHPVLGLTQTELLVKVRKRIHEDNY